MTREIDPVTRRKFLQHSTSIATAVALSASMNSSASANSPIAVRRRKSITALNDAELNAWRAGVRVMKQRSAADANDPRGWTFQASMHGSPTANPMFSLCQHGHWWFLAWHRMYIFYFEQILIQAIGESGVPMPLDFGLPYWDYTEPATGGTASPAAVSKRTIPQPLRDRMYTPTVGMPPVANPLFNSNRITSRNLETNPGPLDASAVSITSAFNFNNFINSSTGVVSGFGGRNRTTPTYSDPNRAGSFELTPHGTVHNGVGGDMASFETAARDPIFWTHHCNLDRLWNVWLALPVTENPALTSPWATQNFKFIDAAGKQVQQPVALFLNNVQGTLIDYMYDDGSTPFAGPMVAFNSHNPGERGPATEAHPQEEMTMADTNELASFPPRLTLDANSKSLKMQLADPAGRRVSSMLSNKAALLLELTGVRVEGPLDGHYEVYLNLPEGTPPDFEGPYYVGNLVPFALTTHVHPEAAAADNAHREDALKAASPDVSVRWDISKLAQQLQAKDLWKTEGPTITFVPKGVEDIEQKAQPRITFTGFRLLENAPKPEKH